MFKVTIRPKTSFITELNSSTIFGAACWSIKDLYGEEVLQEIFQDDTSFAVSNAFISGFIPSGCERNSKLKNLKTGEEIPNTFKTFRVDHCMVDRDTTSSAKQWISYEHFESRDLDIYVSSSLFKLDEINQIFELMLLRGLGKSRNKGKGQFELVDIAETNLAELGDKNPNGYMVISDYIPNKTDTTIGKYSARVINRRTVNGDKCTPVYVINAGSEFIGNVSGEIIGRLHHDEITNTYLSGRAIVIQINHNMGNI